MIRNSQKAVSPVIGIILMVAVTVGLVALAGTIVFDFGENVEEPADVTADLSYDSDASEIRAEVIRNNNAEKVFIRYADGKTTEIAGSEGSTGTVVQSVSGSGTAEVVAVVNGNEQIVQSIDY